MKLIKLLYNLFVSVMFIIAAWEVYGMATFPTQWLKIFVIIALIYCASDHFTKTIQSRKSRIESLITDIGIEETLEHVNNLLKTKQSANHIVVDAEIKTPPQELK